MKSEYVLENAAEMHDCEQQCVISTEYDRKQNIVELISYFLSIGSETNLQIEDESADDAVFLPAAQVVVSLRNL